MGFVIGFPITKVPQFLPCFLNVLDFFLLRDIDIQRCLNFISNTIDAGLKDMMLFSELASTELDVTRFHKHVHKHLTSSLNFKLITRRSRIYIMDVYSYVKI